MSRCPHCGGAVRDDAQFCPLCYGQLGAAPQPLPAHESFPVGDVSRGGFAGQLVVRRMADYVRWSGVFWLGLAVVQVCIFFGVIGDPHRGFLAAGMWNCLAAVSRLRLASAVAVRHPVVPHAFPGVVQLAVIGLVNLVLGGYVGVALVLVDFYVRDRVLSNAHLFAPAKLEPTP